MSESINLEFETVTPLFMYGADQNQPEIRAASIKGMMRWWWRAVVAEDDVKKMRYDESQIFGSTDKKSAFSLYVRTDEKLRAIQCRLLPHSTKRFKSPAIPIGYGFDVKIQSDSELKSASNAFEIAALLGGFGKRARRGFGSITLTSWNFQNVDDVFDTILPLLNYFKNEFEYRDGSIIRKRNLIAAYPFVEKISIGRTTVSSQDNLLVKIGRASHSNSDPSLGRGKPRMASPIYVSILKINNNYAPVVIELNNAFPPNYPKVNRQKQVNFIKEVLM